MEVANPDALSLDQGFLPAILLTTACLAIGLINGIGSTSNAHTAPGAKGIFAVPPHLVLLIYHSTGNVMLAVMLVVLILSAVAYWLRQKMRFVYGAIELCFGVLVPAQGVAQMADDVVARHLTALAANQHLLLLVTGVYFVIRGMTNIHDGIELRPRCVRVDNAVSAGPVEPTASSVAIPAGEHLETPPEVS